MSGVAEPIVRGMRASLYAGDAFWARGQSIPGASPVAFALGVISVVLLYTVSGHTLGVLGLSYSEIGGNPLVKFLPSTYVALFGAAVGLASKSSTQRGYSILFTKAPALVVFFGLIVFCAVFSAANVGLTGVGVYIDTYLPAAAVAIIMVNASDRQRAILARVILALCIINVVIALAEYVHQQHFIPMEYKGEDGKVLTDTDTSEFRPAALYTHPLTGSMATAFAILLLVAVNLRFVTAAASFLLLSVGLLGFGGRAALYTTVGVLVVRVVFTISRDMLQRRFNGRLVSIVLLSLAVLGPLGGFLLTATPVGERIAARSYYDDSAEVRVDQWRVFDHLTVSEAMFGTPTKDLEQLYWQAGVLGVENPFILVFLNLGIVGLPFFAGALLAYFLYMARAYPDSRWLLLSAFVILFSSNSIGVKSPDLFMLTACAVGMKGYARVRAAAPARKSRRQRLLFAHLPPTGLSPDVRGRKDMMAPVKAYRGLSTSVVPRSEGA